MRTQEILNPQQWAETTFGQTPLKDRRRMSRAVRASAHMAKDPAASSPPRCRPGKMYKLCIACSMNPMSPVLALMQPHWQQTCQRMESLPLVLLVQDTTDLDLSHRGRMSGLGAIGDGTGRGVYLQTLLAVEPDSREVLWCASQRPFIRVPAPEGETRTQRRKREKETALWHHCAQHMRASGASRRRVQVADRGAR
jgi:hypothetical protein